MEGERGPQFALLKGAGGEGFQERISGMMGSSYFQ